MTHLEYWTEAVKDSLTTHGIDAGGLAESIAHDMAISYEQYSTAFGYDVAVGNAIADKDRQIEILRTQLLEERQKRFCKSCSGTGYTTSSSGYRTSIGPCVNCHGTGKV